MKQTLHRVLIRGMFLIAIGISLLLTVTHVTAQTGNTVYQGQTTELAAMNEGDFYTWELYNTAAGVNFATDPGNCPLQEAFFIGGVNTGANVFVNWVMPGVYYFKVTAVNAAGGNNLKVGKMTVILALPVAVLNQPGDICVGDPAQLVINLTGTAPWSILVSDGTSTITINNILASPFILTLTPSITTTYTVTSVTDANGSNPNSSNSATVQVFPKPGSSRIYQYVPLTQKK